MPSIPKITIKVPGTSANLGPGFDLMGMALKIYNQFEFQFPSQANFQSTNHKGESLPFAPEDDLVQVAYQSYFRAFLPEVEIPKYVCKMWIGLPLKGGLGSSASAIVAGLSLARRVHTLAFSNERQITDSEFLQFLAEWEGHPDNTLPAYLGGFVFATSCQGEPLRYFRKKFPASIALFLLTPEYTVSTEESRKTLPGLYPTKDVIFNLSRLGSWLYFLEKRRFSDLKNALQDKLHTPYRITESSPLFQITEKLDPHKFGHCLSGSGPSLLIFTERKNADKYKSILENLIAEEFKKQNIPYQFKRIQTDHLGTIIKQS
ncbi:homoserine kinase [Leptospira ryugenii]|nr:homoserine kinase [Leptospira ryugenii]